MTPMQKKTMVIAFGLVALTAGCGSPTQPVIVQNPPVVANNYVVDTSPQQCMDDYNWALDSLNNNDGDYTEVISNFGSTDGRLNQALEFYKYQADQAETYIQMGYSDYDAGSAATNDAIDQIEVFCRS